jgi:hypothetical protein
MASWLVKPRDIAVSTWNVIRSVGPLLVSQADTASEAYARHKARMASVDAGKELLLEEIHTLGEVRKQLLGKMIEAPPDDRVRIRADLNEIGASLRQLRVGAQALSYLGPPRTEQAGSPTEPSEPKPEMSAHWMDKFGEFARAHNEPWREDLLSRALAAESSSPGTVSPRALWLIGTLEERAFNAFATLLDLSASIGGGLMIPNYHDLGERPIPNCILGNGIAIGNLIYILEDVGLFADALTTTRTLRKGLPFVAAYGSSKFLIECNADLAIGGVIPSSIGTSLASFYQPKVTHWANRYSIIGFLA